MLPLPRDLLVQVLPKTLKVKGKPLRVPRLRPCRRGLTLTLYAGCVAKLHVLLLRTFPLGLRKPKGTCLGTFMPVCTYLCCF
jgi:hypothetical protein